MSGDTVGVAGGHPTRYQWFLNSPVGFISPVVIDICRSRLSHGWGDRRRYASGFFCEGQDVCAKKNKNAGGRAPQGARAADDNEASRAERRDAGQ